MFVVASFATSLKQEVILRILLLKWADGKEDSIQLFDEFIKGLGYPIDLLRKKFGHLMKRKEKAHFN